MSAPNGKRFAQLVFAADRDDEEWLLGLDRKGGVGRRESVPQAGKDSKLAKQVKQAVLQGWRVRRDRPVRLTDGAVTEEVALKETELEFLRQVEDDIGEALLMSLATESPGS